MARYDRCNFVLDRYIESRNKKTDAAKQMRRFMWEDWKEMSPSEKRRCRRYFKEQVGRTIRTMVRGVSKETTKTGRIIQHRHRKPTGASYKNMEQLMWLHKNQKPPARKAPPVPHAR